MASDDQYLDFLEKANKDPGEGYAKTQGKGGEFKTHDAGVKIPEVLTHATKGKFYTSEADEPFVPVALNWNEDGKGLPDEEEFAELIHHPDPKKAQIEILDPVDWDTQGQYGGIIEAVTEAGKGNDVRVYQVTRNDTRVEYWVVTTDGTGKHAKLVGAKALSIES